MFTTIKDLPLYSFKYLPKKDTRCIITSIMIEMESQVKKLTTGQGGVDWHYIRATSGAELNAKIVIKLKDLLRDFPH